jgi:hypothetical protein
MGAKTGLLAFADGDVATALRRAGGRDPGDTAALIGRVHPGHLAEPIDDGTLGDDTYPPDDITYAAVLDDVTILCDRRFMLDQPSQLPGHLIDLAGPRRIVLHAMHSVVDWVAFAVWDNGRLVRSLSLSPVNGIVENIGEPLDFELPYWAGEHPVEPIPGWPSEGPYPLPFHPLEFGEEALRALFGFVLEGTPRSGDVDPDGVLLHGYRVADPSGAEQAAREAAMEAALSAMGPPRMFRLGPDGSLVETHDLN